VGRDCAGGWERTHVERRKALRESRLGQRRKGGWKGRSRRPPRPRLRRPRCVGGRRRGRERVCGAHAPAREGGSARLLPRETVRREGRTSAIASSSRSRLSCARAIVASAAARPRRLAEPGPAGNQSNQLGRSGAAHQRVLWRRKRREEAAAEGRTKRVSSERSGKHPLTSDPNSIFSEADTFASRALESASQSLATNI